MLRTIKSVEKIQFFDNSKTKYSLATIKKRTGCTDIMNGGFFNMSTLKPLMHFKVDGIVKVSDPYTYWGLAFNTNSTKFDIVSHYSEYDNYICCVCLLKDGKKTVLRYNSDVGGSRGRTAIGIMPNGDILMYCTKDGDKDRRTPEQVQEYFYRLGANYAMMLDSGGSSQCNFNGKTIVSSRIVSNLILIWEGDKKGTTTDTYSMPGNSHTNNPAPTPEKKPPVKDNSVSLKTKWQPSVSEPTTNVQKNSKGDAAKWVQEMLQKIGYFIDTDGIFGNASDTALRSFQKYWSLSVDGICGPACRNGLKECINAIYTSESHMVRSAVAEIGRTEKDGKDDKYILWYNNHCNCNFSTNDPWCAMFVSWNMQRNNISESKYPRFASCSYGIKYLENNGVVRNSKNYSPKAGDLIFFDSNNDNKPEHVGIVISNDGKYIGTIEGNSSDAVKHNNYLLTSDKIFAYAEII